MKILQFLLKWKRVITTLILSFIAVPVVFGLFMKLSLWLTSLFSIDIIGTSYVIELVYSIDGLATCFLICLMAARFSSQGRVLIFLVVSVFSFMVMAGQVYLINLGRMYFVEAEGLSFRAVDFVTYVSPFLFLIVALYLYRKADGINNRLNQFYKGLRSDAMEMKEKRFEDINIKLKP